MKERGILFSAPMVLALLAGTKSQTRCAVKLPPWTASVTVDEGGTIWGLGPYLKAHRAEPVPDDVGAMERVRCPYGVPGDRLWVRETHALTGGRMPIEVSSIEDADGVVYRADGVSAAFTGVDDGKACLRATSFGDEIRRWRPSLFMPRWASRITLEITDVRVQRLQDITHEDARAEGVDGSAACEQGLDRHHCGARGNYAFLWDDINGKGAWAADPLVWALTFARVPS